MNNRYFLEDILGIEGLNIAWYGVIIAFGVILGLLVACKEAKRQNLKNDLVYDFLMLALPFSIIFARTYYVIFEWEQYIDNPLKVFAVWEGGLAIYGGVIGGFIAAVIFARVHRFPLLRLIDLVVPSLILGQAIGRWGNFVNQEAFGELIINTKLQFFPLAVYIEQLGEWHQATFFYESFWNFGVFILLIFIRKKTKFSGQLLSIYFIAYGIGRFWIEGLRTDSLYLLPGLRVSQALSLILTIAGLMILTFHKKLLPLLNDYNGQYSL